MVTNFEDKLIPSPPLSVVVPVYNEERTLALVVDKLLRIPHLLEIIIVDDGSTDATAEEAREAGAGVLEAPPLVAGASGKANACMAGARILESRWILFADANTRYN